MHLFTEELISTLIIRHGWSHPLYRELYFDSNNTIAKPVCT